MIFSRKCEYAIRALTHLAAATGVCDAREISANQKIPYPYTAKVLQELNRKGFLKSVKGAGGGFALAKSPQRILLIDVVKAIDGEEGLARCVYGFSRCSDTLPCPLHEEWKSLRSAIETRLLSHSLAELAKMGSVELKVKRGKRNRRPASTARPR